MRIFIIGFNKTATRTLHYFFKGNGLNAIHWDDGNLVEVFERNIKLGKKLLFDGVTLNKEVNSDCKYEDAIVFSDMTSSGPLIVKDPKDYYKQLDKEYPNSKFSHQVRLRSPFRSALDNSVLGCTLSAIPTFHAISKIRI